MLKVMITKGLPGSGKTTWAKKYVQEHFNQVKLICKDDLRAMLDDGQWSRDAEKFVLKARDELIMLAIMEKKHVIICDTNLNPSHKEHIEYLVAGLAIVEIIDFTEVSLEDCIKNDLKREKSVGKDVIVDQYERWLKPKPAVIEYDKSLPDAIIVDVDGTIALKGDRDPYDTSRAGEDTPNGNVVDLVRFMNIHDGDGYINVIIVSGRDGEYRELTEKWLELNRIYYNELYMRGIGDKRKDYIVKEEIYNQYIKGKYNIKFVLDDRNQVVEMWRRLGLTCLQVAEGNF